MKHTNIDNRTEINRLKEENARLRVELERLQARIEHVDNLANRYALDDVRSQAHIDRLIKAGDLLGSALILFELKSEEERQERLENWAIAKYGKPRA